MTYYKVCLVFTVASISANAHAPRQSWLLDGSVDSHAAATSDLIPLNGSRSSTGQQSLVTAKDEKSKHSSAVVPLAINWTTSKSSPSQAEKGTKKKKKKKQQQRTEVAGPPPARETKLPVSFAKSGKVASPLRFRRSDWRRNSNFPSLPDSNIFADPVFADSSHATAARYKRQAGNCRKIVRDSMVCTSCTDPKTNGKYEQCSYVAQPKENAYAYSKRSSFGEPATSDKVATPRKQPDEFADQLAREPDEGNSSGDDPAAETSGRDAAHRSSKCEVVQRDSKTCTVCIDPKSGGNYEKCSYAYQPNDKLYKFSRSKSFGYPDSATRSDRRSDRRSHRRTGPASGSQLPATSEASETLLEGRGEASDCRQIKRDSMICSVCRDAKTGGNSETCSYSYQPNDKLFSYSKASSFGSPSRSESDDSSSESSSEPSSEPSSDSSLEGDSSARIAERRSVEQSHEEHAPFSDRLRVLSNEPHRETNASQAGSDDAGDDFFHAANNKAELKELMREFEKQNRSQCETTMRDGMTCYRCVDEKGFRKEECMFVAEQEPSKDRVAYREMKEFQLEPISSTASIQRRRVDKPIEPIEPIAAPSDESYARAEPNEHGASGEPSRRESHDTNEAEPYEYSAETRPVYDKVLGLTLPAYMLATSEHEAEFDEIVASASS